MTNPTFAMVAALLLNTVWCQPKALAQCVATEHAKLLVSNGTDRDFFGGSIAMSGNRVFVGEVSTYSAPGGHSNGAGKTAYVFNFDDDGWKEEGRLVPADLQEIVEFGHSVAVLGDVALVGARFRDDNNLKIGAVCVFRFDGQNWVEEDRLVASDGSAGVGFGNSVAMIG